MSQSVPAALTKHRKLGSLYTAHGSLPVLESGSLRSGYQHAQVRAVSLVHSWCLLAVSPSCRRDWGSSWSLFYEGTNLIPKNFSIMI